MSNRIVKVCGMREPENIREVERLGIDWMGFIFYEKSKRHVPALPAYMPTQVKRIGVFVDYTLTEILDKVEEFHFDGVQLHGNESPQFCKELREKAPYPILINKAFGILTEEDIHPIEAYEGVCDYYVFDTKTPSKGGSGNAFDWNILQAYKGDTPFLLSGGLSIDNLEEMLQFHHERMAGIDLNSKFEISPALKDASLLEKYIKTVRHNE